jgi:hypothetical protein
MKRKTKSFLKVFAIIGIVFFFAVCISLSNSDAAKTDSPSQDKNSLLGNLAPQNYDKSEEIDLSESIKSMALILGLNELHNPPFSSDTPKIQVYLSKSPYSVEIINKEILVRQSLIKNPDLIIRTNIEEAGKMSSDKNYIKESFNSGNSEVEIVAGKMTLLLKGYDKVYSKIA